MSKKPNSGAGFSAGLFLALAMACGLLPGNGRAENERPGTGSGWIIEVPARRLSHDTGTGLTTTPFGTRRGLEFTGRSGTVEAAGFWLPGSHKASITVQGETIIDGTNDLDIGRIGGFRFAADGSTLHVRATKGRDAVVELIHNGRTLRSWPRGRVVQVISFDGTEVYFATRDGRGKPLTISRIGSPDGRILSGQTESLAVLDGCALVTGRKRGAKMLLEMICKSDQGSDIHVLDLKSGAIRPLVTGHADDMFAPLKPEQRGRLPVLSVSGTANAKHAFHAVRASLLTQLGEPRSLGSDAMGTQSWGTSYRMRALAELAEKTGHQAFAGLAVNAMKNVLEQTNRAHGVDGRFNPSCGWASRIYSRDGLEPVSLLVNQAMISGAMLVACDRLGTSCPARLSRRIQANAQCLARHFEPHFDARTGLYRIQHGAPFRFDGVWAPWNWQISWANVLARLKGKPGLNARARSLGDSFMASWQHTATGALWRYWPERYFAGWTGDDAVSVHLPKKSAQKVRRFEDVNHAGISLLALGDSGRRLTAGEQAAGRRTLDRLVRQRFAVSRHLDGSGPATSSWLPASGWHTLATKGFREFYAHAVPNATSGSRHLAYAQLFEPDAPFDLTLTVRECTFEDCIVVKTRTFTSLSAFLEGNGLFRLRRKP